MPRIVAALSSIVKAIVTRRRKPTSQAGPYVIPPGASMRESIETLAVFHDRANETFRSPGSGFFSDEALQRFKLAECAL